ncbi:hypothetical protein CR513_37762, partial [Mucuna pruriens]
MHTSCHLHLVIVYHIIYYLKDTFTCVLFFPTRKSLSLVGYSDAVGLVVSIQVEQSLVGACFFVLLLNITGYVYDLL